MKRTHKEHAARFDAIADEYDDDKSEEYRACVSLVVEAADPAADETVLDVGCGTGAIGLRLAETADRVVGRDVSEGMMRQAERKAAERGLSNVEFGEGTFRDPAVDAADVVVSNFAMHHLSNAEKRETLEVIAGLEPRRFVLGDVMFFGEPDPGEPFYSPEVDDPATVGVLADALTDAGFALVGVEMVHEQVGVLVADRTAP